MKNEIFFLFHFFHFFHRVQGVKAATPVGNAVGRSSPANASAPNASSQNKNTKARKKEEENLQKIFSQVDKPKDEFTVWCTTTLSSLDAEVEQRESFSFKMAMPQTG